MRLTGMLLAALCFGCVTHRDWDAERRRCGGDEDCIAAVNDDQQADEYRRKNIRALGVFLSAFGNRRNQADHPPAQTPNNVYGAHNSATSPAVADQMGCSNDFACGAGMTCVKPLYQSEGTCAKKVDASGVQQFTGPSNDSIGPNMKPQCQVMTDCPVSFRCWQGSCVR